MVTYLKKCPPKPQAHSALPAHFYPAQFLCNKEMSLLFRDIFFDAGSMTKKIKELSNDQMSVTVLDHSWQKPHESERKILSQQNVWGIGREVVLSGINVPWIYARSFFPMDVVKAHGQQFTGLGQRPLGEILFSDPRISRSDYSIACLLPGHREYQVAADAFKLYPEFMWARRSQFYLPSGAIVLLEVFSPLMEKYVAQSESLK